MLKNYCKTIIRNIRRNKVFTMINVVGLSLGLAAFITISEYVKFESSYDAYNPNAEEIFRLGMHVNLGDGEITAPFMGAPAAAALKADFPEVVSVSRLYAWLRRDYFVKVGDLELKEKNMTRLMADANFFQFFSIPLIQGNIDQALQNPFSVVITRSTAEKYFGDNWETAEVLGKFFEMDGLQPLQITGVSEDVPANTHFNYNFLISMNSVEESRNTHWLSNSMYHYFQLLPGTDIADFMAKVDDKAEDYINQDIQDFLGTSYSEFFGREGTFFNFYEQSLSSIHLDSHFELELAVNGDRKYVTIFRVVSFLVLLMAAINFMNLSTVAGLKRNKEVGIRKVLGSLRSQLVFQFLFESTLIVLISLVFAVTAIQLATPWINGAIGISVIPLLAQLQDTVFGLMFGAIVLGIVSGLYPALILSSLNPTSALSGRGAGRKGINLFRNVLIIFQFSISLLLMVGVVVIFSQIQHMKSQDLGYAKDQVVLIHDMDQLGDQAQIFRDRLKDHASVVNASLSGFVPIGSDEYGVSGYRPIDGENDQTLRVRSAFVDEFYVDTYGLEILRGRNFEPSRFNDSRNIIVNEKFIQFWNWSAEEALGKRILNIGNQATLTIVGVINDFQVASMKEALEPFFFEYNAADQGLALKFVGSQWESVRKEAETIWAELTNKPFSYTFVNQMFESTMESERKAGKLFTILSVLAIVIGGLGLLGVASFIILERSKEVGIRKVLGASLPELFITLSKGFVNLVLMSALVAIPLAYYLLDDWLNQYTYKVGLSFFMFAVPFVAVMLIALSIVGTQVIKVSIINPIKSLRYE